MSVVLSNYVHCAGFPHWVQFFEVHLPLLLVVIRLAASIVWIYCIDFFDIACAMFTVQHFNHEFLR